MSKNNNCNTTKAESSTTDEDKKEGSSRSKKNPVSNETGKPIQDENKQNDKIQGEEMEEGLTNQEQLETKESNLGE